MSNSISKKNEKLNVKSIKTEIMNTKTTNENLVNNSSQSQQENGVDSQKYTSDQIDMIKHIIGTNITYYFWNVDFEISTIWDIAIDTISDELGIECDYEDEFIGNIFDKILEEYKKENKFL